MNLWQWLRDRLNPVKRGANQPEPGNDRNLDGLPILDIIHEACRRQADIIRAEQQARQGHGHQSNGPGVLYHLDPAHRESRRGPVVVGTGQYVIFPCGCCYVAVLPARPCVPHDRRWN